MRTRTGGTKKKGEASQPNKESHLFEELDSIRGKGVGNAERERGGRKRLDGEGISRKKPKLHPGGKKSLQKGEGFFIQKKFIISRSGDRNCFFWGGALSGKNSISIVQPTTEKEKKVPTKKSHP